MDKFAEVLKQAPADIDEETIKIAFAQNQEDVLNTLSELWKMPRQAEKEKSKWEQIRETCDAYDEEMDRVVMSHIRNQKQAPSQAPSQA
jgi:superoxide dismutase